MRFQRQGDTQIYETVASGRGSCPGLTIQNVFDVMVRRAARDWWALARGHAKCIGLPNITTKLGARLGLMPVLWGVWGEIWGVVAVSNSLI